MSAVSYAPTYQGLFNYHYLIFNLPTTKTNKVLYMVSFLEETNQPHVSGKLAAMNHFYPGRDSNSF